MDRKSREIGSFLGEKAYLREIFIRNNPKIQKSKKFIIAKIHTGNHRVSAPRIVWLTDHFELMANDNWELNGQQRKAPLFNP